MASLTRHTGLYGSHSCQIAGISLSTRRHNATLRGSGLGILGRFSDKMGKMKTPKSISTACRSGAFSQSVSSAVIYPCLSLSVLPRNGCSQPQRLICPARGPCTRHIVPGGICRVTWTCEGMPNEPRKGPGNGPAVINLRHPHPSEEERLFSSQMLVTPVLAIPSRFCIYRIYVIMS